MEKIHPVDAKIGTAIINYSRTVYSALVLSTFDENGLYNKTDWEDEQLISEQLMDKIEDAIYWNTSDLLSKFDDVAVNSNETNDTQTAIDFYVNGEVTKTIYIDKIASNIEISPIEPIEENIMIWINTSEDNDTDILARINDNTVASNTTWSSEKILDTMGNIDISGGSGGDINLSKYATKEYVDTKVNTVFGSTLTVGYDEVKEELSIENSFIIYDEYEEELRI